MTTIYRAFSASKNWVSEDKFAKDGFSWYKPDGMKFVSREAALEYVGSKEVYADFTDITILEFPIFRVGCSEKKFVYVEVEAESFKGALNLYYEDNIRIYDADNCGNEDYSFIVINPEGTETKYFNATYDWYITWEPEWELISNFDIVEVANSDALKEKVVADRDWLVVSNRDWIKV